MSKVTVSVVSTDSNNLTDPELKEKMATPVPRNVTEVARYDYTLTSTEGHIKTSAAMIADRFGIGLERARQTLKATTQKGTRPAFLPISRRYRADRQFGAKRLNDKFDTDTIRAKSRTLSSNFRC